MSDAHDRKQAAPSRSRKRASASADEDDEETSAAEEAHEPRECMPCHGTGKVISNLGEHVREVTCPWCRGSGERLTGADAQEFQQEQAALKRR